MGLTLDERSQLNEANTLGIVFEKSPQQAKILADLVDRGYLTRVPKPSPPGMPPKPLSYEITPIGGGHCRQPGR